MIIMGFVDFVSGKAYYSYGVNVITFYHES
jgi:hypothetical protein